MASITLPAEHLAALLHPMQRFCKAAEALVDGQLGKEIEKKAADVAADLLARGEITQEDQENAAQQLHLDKAAALAGITQLAAKTTVLRQKLATASLGESIKAASDGDAHVLPSEQKWQNGFGNLQ